MRIEHEPPPPIDIKEFAEAPILITGNSEKKKTPNGVIKSNFLGIHAKLYYI
ncbi:MAG: hypothetical protein ISR55_10515 [Bacteroidetes bacterium]|nr:hypothetical protein [Bacteroidota bacterium]MBL6964247.1 hypothetical protein [Bacteroidota bacterium]